MLRLLENVLALLASPIRDTSARFFYLKNIQKCVSTIVTKLGWTGWLLVLVYLGALTAISDYIANWFLFSEELLFYEVFITVIVSTAVLYILTRVYSALRVKNSTSKWWGRGLKMLSIIFGLIGFVYLSIRSEEHTSELQSRQYLVCR